MLKHYLVGGAVRDLILGQIPNDYDYVVTGCNSFQDLVDYVKTLGYLAVSNSASESGFVEFPEVLTLKARHPELGIVEDFACARKEFDYSDRRHPAKVEIGTLEEDLARRDFTCNAMAQDLCTGEVIDLFGGRRDLKYHVLDTVGLPSDRFAENPDRIIRAFRFACRYNLNFSPAITLVLISDVHVNELLRNENDDVKTKSLNKILSRKENLFRFMNLLQTYPLTASSIFSNVGLMSTNKKGFN